VGGRKIGWERVKDQEKHREQENHNVGRPDIGSERVKIGEEDISAILDTRCELTILKGNLYEKVRQRGNKYLQLPAQNLTLVMAFNEKSWQVKGHIFCL
jgi:hypothetical protein